MQNFRLSNQVVMVHGKYSSALYDLFGGKIQRISRGLAEALENRGGEMEGGEGESAELYILVARLMERGFLCGDAKGAESLRFENKYPRLPSIRTISFEVGGGTGVKEFARIVRIIEEAYEWYGLCSFAFCIDFDKEGLERLDRLVFSLLRRLKFSVCEFWFGDDESFLHMKNGVAMASYRERIALVDVRGFNQEADDRKALKGWGAEVDKSDFVCSSDFFFLVKNWGESYGCIHFDKSFNAYPDVSELDYFMAPSGDGGLKEILNKGRLQKYWGVNKDARDKCRDCEYRYACPNPLSKRSVPEILTSAPSNCSYDLEPGLW